MKLLEGAAEILRSLLKLSERNGGGGSGGRRAFGGLGFALHLAESVDPLTAYLATSPGGADSVAIIAASSPKARSP